MGAKLKILLCLYFLILLVLAPFLFPYGDTFYYWEWGNHLALSYLDGPPMIAYMMRLSTTFFGNTFFALNIVGTLCAAGVCYFIYKIGALLRDETTGILAACLWVLFPLVAQNLFIRVTYDAPENLFWAATLYYAACYTLNKKSKFLYILGITAGLLLLSKYTGIIVISGVLLYFMMTAELRSVFRNPHLYIAALVCLALFSPVLIWNAGHHWISFAFQFGQHTVDHPISVMEHFGNMINFLWRLFYCLNLFLIVPVLLLLFKRPKAEASLVRRLLITVSITFIVLWFLGSYSAYAKINYFLPLTTTMSLLLADSLLRYHYRKCIMGLVVLFLLISLVFISSSTIWFGPKFSYEYPIYLIQKNLMLEAQKNGPTTIVTTGWNSVPRLEFLAKKYNLPQVIIPKHACDLGLSGQYQFWGEPMQRGQYPRALYLNVQYPYPECVTPYFKTCRPLQSISYTGSQIFTHQPLAVTIYKSECQN